MAPPTRLDLLAILSNLFISSTSLTEQQQRFFFTMARWLERNEINKMVRCLASQFHFRNTTEIVGDSNPLALCTRRDERYVCCPSSLGLLDAVARLMRFGATVSPRPSELPVDTSTLRVSQNRTALSLPARQEHV